MTVPRSRPMIDMPHDFHILLFGMIVLLFSAIYMHYSNRIFDLSSISISSVWYFAYVATIFIPSFFTFYEKIGPYRFNYIYAMASPLITVPAGISLANVLWKYNPQEIKQFYLRAIEDRPKSFIRILNYSFLLFIGIVLFFSWCIEQRGKPIPVIYALTHPQNPYQDLAMLRDYSLKLLDSPFRYLYHTTRDFLLPLLMLVALCNYYYSRSRGWLFFLIVSSCFGFFFATANIAKGPTFNIALLLLLNFYIIRRGKLPSWMVIIGIALALIFPVFIYMIGNISWDGFTSAFSRIMERIFVAPAAIGYYCFEIVPERLPFQWGRSIGAIVKLLGLEVENYNSFVTWYIMGVDSTTSMSGVFVIELFGDFAFPGVILGGILVGIAMQWVHVSIIRNRKTLFAIVTYVLFIRFFSDLTTLQIAGALILSGAPFLWIMYKAKILG